MKLARRYIDKPWGRDDLPRQFGAPRDERIGEIWYEGAPAGFPLLAKYLFTSAKLSIQVHPGTAAAHARGLPSGKEECWYVTTAEPGATIGIGTTRRVDAAELREAALSGAIEELVDWRAVVAGDHFFVPAGTIHAIGPGVTLVEIQQAADITYRLYDYGRPRDLHLDDAVDVADARPHPAGCSGQQAMSGDANIADCDHFAVRLCGGRMEEIPENVPLIVLPLSGSATVGDVEGRGGDCLYAPNRTSIRAENGARMILAWPKR